MAIFYTFILLFSLSSSSSSSSTRKIIFTYLLWNTKWKPKLCLFRQMNFGNFSNKLHSFNALIHFYVVRKFIHKIYVYTYSLSYAVNDFFVTPLYLHNLISLQFNSIMKEKEPQQELALLSWWHEWMKENEQRCFVFSEKKVKT